MARGPSRFITRIWLDEALKARKLDAVAEMVKLYEKTDDENIKLRILDLIWERVYPKAKPEDNDGRADEVTVNNVQITDELLQKLIKTARGES